MLPVSEEKAGDSTSEELECTLSEVLSSLHDRCLDDIMAALGQHGRREEEVRTAKQGQSALDVQAIQCRKHTRTMTKITVTDTGSLNAGKRSKRSLMVEKASSHWVGP